MKKNLLSIVRALVFVLPLSLCFTSCEGFDLEELFGNIIKPGGGEEEDGDSEKSYYQIAPEDLNGWDEGVFYGNEDGTDYSCYIVSQTDTTDGTITVCLNEAANADADKSLIFHFSKEGDVLKVLLAGYHFEAQSYDEKVDFVVYDKEGEVLGGFSVPYEKVDTISSTRSPFFNSKGKFSVSKTMPIVKFMEKGANVLGSAYNLSEGNYGDFLSNFLLGTMTASVKSFFGRIFLPIAIKEILDLSYNEAKRAWMGDATIQINSVKRTSGTTITVKGEIIDTYTIPLILISTTNGVVNYEDNVVRYGVAVGRNSYPGLYLNENCSDLEVVVDDKEFAFTFYMEETPGEVFYFRPFLVPEYKLKGKEDLFPTPYTCIRYGEAKKFMDMSVDLSNFKQVKCTKVGEEYNVQFTIDGKIPGLFDDLQNWGIKVATESQKSEFWGGDRYYADKLESYRLPTEMNFTCNVKVKEDDIESDGEERIAKITITPFVEVGFNLENTYLEAEDYEITITNDACPDANHVHAVDLGLSVKWACCNVGASVPEGYGGYYAWGETEEKSDYTYLTYKYYLGDLNSDYFVDSNEYQNIGSIISGTSYDVARVKWGGSWRMPTLDEIKELCNKCSWQWTEVNGINGQKVIGPNGNSIFLPAAGYRDGEDVYDRGACGIYWSATLLSGKSFTAYCLYFDFGYCGLNNGGNRYIGRTVRPVTE